MPFHWNPFRLYRSVVQLNHGIFVEMLRNTQIFWKSYKELLEINKKKESDEASLRKLMKKMALVPDQKKIFIGEKREKVLLRILSDFTAATTNLEKMLVSLDIILSEDQTFLFKTYLDIESLYWKMDRIQHLPEHMSETVKHHLHSIMEKIVEKESHASQVAKAHAKGFFKFADVELTRTRREDKRIRRQTIELNQVHDRITRIKTMIDRMTMVKGEELHEIANKLEEIVGYYKLEIDDLTMIIHEADVLIYRTEQLFKAIEREAAQIGSKEIKEKVEECAKVFHKIHKEVSLQSGIEYRDILSRYQRIPVPRQQKLAA